MSGQVNPVPTPPQNSWYSTPGTGYGTPPGESYVPGNNWIGSPSAFGAPPLQGLPATGYPGFDPSATTLQIQDVQAAPAPDLTGWYVAGALVLGVLGFGAYLATKK